MIRMLYFAGLRERLGQSGEALPVEDSHTVADLIARLRQRGGVWAETMDAEQTLMMAVNQVMAGPQTRVSDGDEVALFPPVTGG